MSSFMHMPPQFEIKCAGLMSCETKGGEFFLEGRPGAKESRKTILTKDGFNRL